MNKQNNKKFNNQKQVPIIRKLYNAQMLPLSLNQDIVWNRLEVSAGSFLVTLPDKKYIDLPLHLAVKKNMPDCVRLLYRLGAYQTRDFKQWYPIHYITRLPERDACIMLLALIRSRDDLYLKTAFDETVETMAEVAKMDTLLKLIEWVGRKFPYMLHVAVQEGDTDKITMLLASGANKYQQDQHGFYPVHYSAMLTKQDLACTCVSLLMTSKHDRELKTKLGDTLYTLLDQGQRYDVKKFIDNLDK